MQKQLDARLLAAFHAVELEDMPIIINYVEFMAEKRRQAKNQRVGLSLVVSNHAPLKVISVGNASRDPKKVFAFPC